MSKDLEDNKCDTLRSIEQKNSSSFSDEELSDLQRIADTPINKLISEDNKNLLIFPHSFEDCQDQIGEKSILSLKYQWKENHRIPVSLETGNIMGFIGINNTQLDIKSRFAKADKEDFFLHYMLQKVYSINLFDLQHNTNESNIFDFLLYLFSKFLKDALSQGLYKRYCHKEYNDANVRGAIDVNRHTRFNRPFNGKVAYHTHEFSYDNPLTELIRHTVEFIRGHKQGNVILSNNEEIKDAVAQITYATPSYNKSQRVQVINQNLRPISHPYFNKYTALQKICLQIIRHEGLKYGKNDNKIYGVLFDGAWLWEEYLNTILHQLNFKHPQNNKRKDPVYLFQGKRYSRYPDFYINNQIVLDAKYKQLKARQIDRNDMHQIISYMHILETPYGGFIHPQSIDDKGNNRIKISIGELNGSAPSEILLYTFPIPLSDTWVDFQAEMYKMEEKLKDEIIIILSLLSR